MDSGAGFLTCGLRGLAVIGVGRRWQARKPALLHIVIHHTMVAPRRAHRPLVRIPGDVQRPALHPPAGGYIDCDTEAEHHVSASDQLSDWAKETVSDTFFEKTQDQAIIDGLIVPAEST